MVTKKEAIVVGALAIGGIALASAVAGKGEEDFPGLPRSALSGGGLDRILNPDLPPTAGFQTPAQPNVIFPAPVDYSDFLARFFRTPEQPSYAAQPKKVVSRGGGVRSINEGYASEVAAYGYSPSLGAAYVSGGTGFTRQPEAAEVAKYGYSPSLGALYTGTKVTAPVALAAPVTAKKVVSSVSKSRRGRRTYRGSVKGGSTGGYTGHGGTKKGASKKGTSRARQRRNR